MADEEKIAIEIGGIRFRNPVFTASGIWGYGDEISSLVDVSGLGAIVTKTITVAPREGNPPPRIHELSTGLLNSIGLENVGVDAFIDSKLPLLKEKGVSAIVSMAGDRAEEFEILSDKLASQSGFLGVEINLSCPNVEKGHLDHGSDPKFVESVTASVKSRFPDRAVLVKLTPNLTDISDVALAAEDGGADGITAINTLLGADFDLETGKAVFARVRAGYSGPGILPIALEKVWEVSQAVSVPVVGVGGISSIEDARKFFLAGARAIEVGTALFADPGLASRIVEALKEHPEWMAEVDQER